MLWPASARQALQPAISLYRGVGKLRHQIPGAHLGFLQEARCPILEANESMKYGQKHVRSYVSEHKAAETRSRLQLQATVAATGSSQLCLSLQGFLLLLTAQDKIPRASRRWSLCRGLTTLRSGRKVSYAEPLLFPSQISTGDPGHRQAHAGHVRCLQAVSCPRTRARGNRTSPSCTTAQGGHTWPDQHQLPFGRQELPPSSF